MNPKYVAEVGAVRNSRITRGEFLVQMGVSGQRRITQHHWEPIVIDSFTLIVIRDTVVLVQYKNHGDFFEANLRKAMTALKTNDLVLIFNIYGRDVGDKLVQPPPLQYEIE